MSYALSTLSERMKVWSNDMVRGCGQRIWLEGVVKGYGQRVWSKDMVRGCGQEGVSRLVSVPLLDNGNQGHTSPAHLRLPNVSSCHASRPLSFLPWKTSLEGCDQVVM